MGTRLPFFSNDGGHHDICWWSTHCVEWYGCSPLGVRYKSFVAKNICRYRTGQDCKRRGIYCIVGSKRFVCASTVVESVNNVGVQNSYKNILEDINFANLYPY